MWLGTILVKGTITITGEGDNAAAERADERDKGVTFKNCAPFTKCIINWVIIYNNYNLMNNNYIWIIIIIYWIQRKLFRNLWKFMAIL